MVESIEYLFRERIVGPVSYLFDPGRRIAWVYLLISGILACIWYMYVLKFSFRNSIREIFKKE